MSEEKRERDRFVGFAFAAADLLLEVEADGRIAFAAGAGRAFTGEEADRLVGRPLSVLLAVADRPLVARMIEQARPGARSGPLPVVDASGRVAARLSVLRLREGAPAQLVLQDVGAPTLAPILAERDSESGLLSRFAFERRAEAALAEARRGGTPLELSLVRLEAADGAPPTPEVLAPIAAVLRRLAVAPDLAGRLGPDRLALVHAPGEAAVLEAELAAALPRELRASRTALALADGLLSDGEAAQALGFVLQRFASDLSGGRDFASLEAALGARLDHTVARMGELRRTIEQGRLGTAFQPVVELESRMVRYFEVLTRFPDHRRPAEEIPFAESVGLIADLDLAVASRALAILGAIDDPAARPVLAVNLSARSLASDSFVDALRRRCARAGRTARKLAFEITESAELADLGRAARVVESLKRDGHKVALDDFGAGAAAFHYLRALPVDTVKLDGAYARSLLSSPRDAALVRSIVRLCSELGMSTVAEMVESEDQARALAELGVSWLRAICSAHRWPSCPTRVRPSRSPKPWHPGDGPRPCAGAEAASDGCEPFAGEPLVAPRLAAFRWPVPSRLVMANGRADRRRRDGRGGADRRRFGAGANARTPPP